MTPPWGPGSLALGIVHPPSKSSRRARTLVAGLLGATALVGATAVPPASPASANTDAIVGVVLEGGGFGHGRGMSQWGAYGYAVDEGWTWQQILAHYYGDTQRGALTDADFVGVAPGRMTVEVTSMRTTTSNPLYPGATVVVSSTAQAQWVGDPQGRSFGALKAREIRGQERTYEIWGRAATTCVASGSLDLPDGPIQVGATGAAVRTIQQFLTELGFNPGGIDGSFGPMTAAAVVRFQDAARAAGHYGGSSDGIWGPGTAAAARVALNESNEGWELLGTASGAAGEAIATFTTPINDLPNTAVNDVLGLCTPNGVVRYRGSLSVANGSSNENVTVNDVDIEDYVRGIVSKEMSDAWGNAGGGRGLHALRAQAVAARTYALAQGIANRSGRRFSYAKTCDSMSCQVYGGASAERPNGTVAVADTAGVVLRRGGVVISTEYTASSGGRTAGGAFPSVVDVGDATAPNPRATWTRLVTPAQLLARCSGHGGRLTAVATEADPSLTSLGMTGGYAVRMRVTGPSGSCTIRHEALRTGLGLPSGSFVARAVTRGATVTSDFAFIGDSVGDGMTRMTGAVPALLDGVFRSVSYDAVANRRTVASGAVPADGLTVARDLNSQPRFVVVGLGYNDGTRFSASMVDQMMRALVDRGVTKVGWITLGERKTFYAPSNAVLRDAVTRWPQLQLFDWQAHSGRRGADRWFFDYGRSNDGVHLSLTGTIEKSLWLRDQILTMATGTAPSPAARPSPTGANAAGSLDVGASTPSTPSLPRTPVKVAPNRVLRIPLTTDPTADGQVASVAPPPSAVAVTITAVDADAVGYVTAWPCDQTRPETSVVNVVPGATVPNTVIVPVARNGELCVFASTPMHLRVDVSGRFGADVRPISPPRRLVDSRLALSSAQGPVTRFRLRIPREAQAAGLTLTVTEPRAAGFVTVWPCDQPRPEASLINFVRGQTVANSVVVPVPADRRLCGFSSVPTQVLVDLEALFISGYSAVGPTRVLDTRLGLGGYQGRRTTMRVPVGELIPGARAVVMNLTAVNPVAAGSMVVWPCEAVRPTTPLLEYRAGQTVANSVVVPLGTSGDLCIRGSAATHLLIDVAGGITGDYSPVGPTRVADTQTMVGPIPGR